MRRALRIAGFVALALLLTGAATLRYVMTMDLTARAQAGWLETRLARAARSIAVPRDIAARSNPIEVTPDVIANGRAHFADHCASCHANNGSGETELGQGLFPRSPDMRLAATQDLSDGELFWIIENGIRFTGMPAWGTNTPEGEEQSWHIVHFIRRLPSLTAEEIAEMKAMNPRSPAEIREEIEAERFLEGGGEPPPSAPPPHVH